MPFFQPKGEILLDVILRRGDDVRRWTVSSGHGPGEWDCRLVEAQSVTVFACTDENVAATVLKWRAEIDAANAEGWT